MRTPCLSKGRWFPQLIGSLLGLSFFLSGCVTIPPRKITRREKSVPTATEIISSLRQRNDYIRSLRTITRLKLATPDGQRSFSASLLVQKPHFIRLEVLNMFMQPVQFFIINEQNLLWYIPADNRVIKGAPTNLNIYRLLGIRLSVSELVSILLGGTPLPAGDIQPALSYQKAEDSYLLQFCLKINQCADKIWLDPYWLYGVRLVHAPEPSRGWEANWGDFEQLRNHYYLPTRIKLERLDQACWLELEYDQPVINEPLSHDKFLLDLPPGTETVPLES